MNESNFQSQQRNLIEMIRDQRFCTDPRLSLYQDLILSGNMNLLTKSFPVLTQILTKAAWDEIVKGYLRDYRNPTPIYHEIPRYFIDYLVSEGSLPADLIELAHYEWLELYVDTIDCELVFNEIDSKMNIHSAIPVINPSLQLVEYQFPVHCMGPSHYPLEKKQTYLALYRDQSDRVAFIELSLLSARVLHLLETNVIAIKTLIESMNQELDLETDSQILSLIQQWCEQGIILEMKSCA